ncbi:MAG: glycosyltransferase, partial [Novosphingobium sp.]
MSGRHDVLFFPSSGVRSGPVPATTQFRLAVVGNYPPRRCGIATFTADMVEALTGAAPEAAVDIYAMTRDPQVRPEAGVSHLVVEDDRASYREAGLVIERSRADAVWVQHEFGIFGGDAGEWLIDLLAPIAAPIVVTLHTVLAEPTPAQERVMAWLVAHASRIVVMSERGAAILGRRADVRPEQVVVLEHGAP